MSINMTKPWEVIRSEQGPNLVLFQTRYDWVRNPRNAKSMKAAILECADWVNIVAITPESKTLVVEQFGVGRTTAEIPARIIEIGETSEQAANVSFFIVKFLPGHGPKKHRHPYEETFILLEGEFEAIVDEETLAIRSGQIAIIPARAWHEFKNCSYRPIQMINIHPLPKMVTEWA